MGPIPHHAGSLHQVGLRGRLIAPLGSKPSQSCLRFHASVPIPNFRGSFDMPAPEKALRIDIPVKLSDAKLVFSVGALQFEGDLPASIFHMQLIKNDIVDWAATSEIVAVFHTNAGHVTLHDSAYNADRN